MWRSVTSILGYGAIGLGFLLAVLYLPTLAPRLYEPHANICVRSALLRLHDHLGSSCSGRVNNTNAGALTTQIDTLRSESVKDAKAAASKVQY